MTISIGNATLFKVRHTKDAARRIALARASFTDATKQVENVAAILRRFSHSKLATGQARAIMERIFPKTQKDDNGRATWATRTENIVDDILKLYETSQTIRGLQGAQGTAYGLLNAVTEWTNHLRGVRETENRSGMSEDQMRAENALFGAGNDLMTRAMREIQTVAGVDGANVLQSMLQ